MFFYVFIVFTPISTTSGIWSTGNTRKYQQIDVYIYLCAFGLWPIFCDTFSQKMCNAAVPDMPLHRSKQTGLSLVIFLGVEQFHAVRFFVWYVIGIPWVVRLYVEIIHEL